MWILLIPIVLLGLLSLVVVFLFFRKWKLALVCAISCIVINWVTQTFPVNSFLSDDSKDRDLRVAAYNIDCLGWGEKHEGWENELIDFIEEANADILFLSEFQYHDFGKYTHLLDSIKTTVFYSQVVDVKFGRKDVLYSKFPISDFHVVRVNPNYCSSELYKEMTVDYYQNLNPMIYQMKVKLKGKYIQLVCCHLASNEFNVAMNLMKEKGVSVFLSNLNKGYLFREVEANSIVAALDTINPTILMGDLNDINCSTTLSIFKRAGLEDGWWSAGTGYGNTYYKKGLYYRLDHILTSKDIGILDIRVSKCQASDHYPIIADIYVK